MDVRSAIISMINAIPGTWPVASAYLGMNETALKNRAYELKGQAVRTHDALRLQDFSGSTLFAEAIAIASGGTFVKLPAVGHIGNEQITDKFHEIFEELGQLSAEFRAFTADGEIDAKEQEQLNETVDKMHRTMDELRALTFKVHCHETAETMRTKRGGK